MRNRTWLNFLLPIVLVAALAAALFWMAPKSGGESPTRAVIREAAEDGAEDRENGAEDHKDGAADSAGSGGTEVSQSAAVKEETPLPSSYDGRQEGRVPSIKNQGTLGTCWAFASLMALEARLLPGEAVDFSEDHMSLGNGFCIPQENGGEYTMSMAYLLSWKGPVTEEMDPYGDGYSPEGIKAVKHVQEIQLIPAKDYAKIKRAILQYGGVQSSLYTSLKNDKDRSVYYNEERSAYCYVGSNPPNHDSVIIGWDDNYPKENFNREVNGDGAFICMNSWGDQFGEQGFFYVSYYDSNIGMSNVAYTVVENPGSYDRIYQSDLRGWVGQLGYNSDTVWMANVYRTQQKETLKAVGFYATDRHTSYEVYVARSPGEEETITDGGLSGKGSAGSGFSDRVLVAAGKFDYAGYYTVPLDPEDETVLQLDEGERYGVIVQVNTPDSVHPAAIEYDAKDGRTKVDIEDGEGYISQDGGRWTRVETQQNCNICLKAYTINR